MKKDLFIERRIVTGLIVSTAYIETVRKVFNTSYLEASMAKVLAKWCLDFYDKYGKAPGQEIEAIFLQNTKGLRKEEKEDIEDILADLSDEYERIDKFNVGYLVDQTLVYFDEQSLEGFIREIREGLDVGDIVRAKDAAYAYKPVKGLDDTSIDLSSPELSENIEKAFKEAATPLFTYPRQLGSFLNPQLTRGAFIAFMAPEKRGKTFLLLDMMIRAASQGVNVAFFQAGDMTQEQQLRRICIHLAKKSDDPRYSGEMYEPVRDCVHNQLDTCDLEQRECDFGVFEGESVEHLRKHITEKELIACYEKNEDYKPCHNCAKYWKNSWGAVWVKKVNVKGPLTVKEAKKKAEDFFVKKNRRVKLATYPSRTLTPQMVDTKLEAWEKEDGFVADMVIVDYVDIMVSETKEDFRHQENKKWMSLRSLSQKRHQLFITVTQTDADSYNRDTLSLRNYSEDKRKYAHVTAMYGMNQDREGREKRLGILRLNEILLREGGFSENSFVYVLQNLRRGQPVLSSFW